MGERWKVWRDTGAFVLTLLVSLATAIVAYGAGQYHWAQTDDSIRQIKVDASEYKRVTDSQIANLTRSVDDIGRQNNNTLVEVAKLEGKTDSLIRQLTMGTGVSH